MKIIQKIKSEVEDWVDFAENIWDILKDLWGDIVQLFPWRNKQSNVGYLQGAVYQPRLWYNPIENNGEYGISLFGETNPTKEKVREILIERYNFSGEQADRYIVLIEHSFPNSFQPPSKHPAIKTKFLDGYEPK